MARSTFLSLLVFGNLALASIGTAQLDFELHTDGSNKVHGRFMLHGIVTSQDITFHVSIDNEDMPSDRLTRSNYPMIRVPYAIFRERLHLHRTSTDDQVAVASLPLPNLLSPMVSLTRANAKALEIIEGSDEIDFSITFNSNVSWDTDPSDGIAPGAYDFVGVLQRELIHGLGFVSGVDSLFGFISSQHRVTSLDMFRYSAPGVQGILSWLTGPKYFSIDGGITNQGNMSLGLSVDGQLASSWKASLGLGIMDPVVQPGQRLTISPNDLRALDVIGYDIR